MAGKELEWGLLGEEERYPEELTRDCELLERLSGREACETLLVRERRTGRLLVAKCWDKASFNSGGAEILGRLEGPGLPAFVGTYENEEMRCVLRAYIPGQTLDKAAENGMTENQVREIGLGLCRILRCLHSQDPPVIHRDIKPQNVVLTEEGEVYLIDFGISRRYDRTAAADTVISGTQDFAPPEQYGFSQTDCRSDIFSLGVLLYWLTTGLTKVGPVKAGRLDRCIRRCTAFDPKDRYRDVEAVERALRGAGRRPRRRWLALLAAAALFFGWARAGGGSAAVSFQEPLIEQAVRLALDKAEGEKIMQSELAQVEGIYIVCGDVCRDSAQYWAEGAGHDAVRLEEAGGGLASLEDLRLLPNLRELGVSGGSVSDLSPLAELEGLRSVDLRYNQVASVEALGGKPLLELVGLARNPVEDLAPLASCPSLRTLDLCGVPGLTGDMLRALGGSYSGLDISGIGAPNYGGCLAGKELRRLVVNTENDPALSVLSGILGLESLELRGESVLDLSALEEHTSLRQLCLAPGTTAEDLTVLTQLPALERATLPAGMEEAVLALGEISFAVEYQ